MCEHLGGIIIAPSVEAKRLGIKLGTTVWDARKIYPKIVLLPVDPDKYRHVTAGFLRILMDYTQEVEKASIDEAFADLTSTCSSYDEALLIGLEIKQRLRQEVGEWVSCSIGIGPNKLLAKIAADLDGGIMSVIAKRPAKQSPGIATRPAGARDDKNFLDRIRVIKPEDVPWLYDRLKLTDIPGIAHRLERSLNLLGIFSLRELAQYPVANLLNQFGIGGYYLHQLANFGFSPSPFLPLPQGARENFSEEEIKSIGHSYTLPKAINDMREIKKLMFKLAEKIGRRMRRAGAAGSIIHYFHSGPSLLPSPLAGEGRRGWFSKQHKIAELINDGREIYKVAWRIFAKNSLHAPSLIKEGVRGSSIKIMGISVSGLKFGRPPEPLFEQYKKPIWLVNAMDKINNKYGEFTIRRGRLVGIPEEWGKDTVGFGRMKEFTTPSLSPS